MVDYYKILEISRTATTVDVKKAYRKLALKWHPDKNPDNLDESNKKFKELSEAYEVLIDDKKRKIYDQYGKEGLQFPGGKRRREDDFDPQFSEWFVFRDPEDVFREFFNGTPFNDLFDVLNGGSGRRGGHRNNSRHNILNNPFMDLSLSSSFGLFGAGGDGFSSFSSFCSAGGSPVGAAVRKTSTSTRFMNGKKITTQKVIEGGKEIISFYENDVLKSKTVNGVPQSITLNEASTSRQVNDKIIDTTSTTSGNATKALHTDNLNRIKSNQQQQQQQQHHHHHHHHHHHPHHHHHHHSHTNTKSEKTKKK